MISASRFNRLAERVVVAPVLDRIPAAPTPPWHVAAGEQQVIAVNLLATMPIGRLLERVGWAGAEPLRQAQRAVRAITG